MLLKMVPKLLVLEGVFLLVLNDVHANGEHLDVYEDDKLFFMGMVPRKQTLWWV